MGPCSFMKRLVVEFQMIPTVFLVLGMSTSPLGVYPIVGTDLAFQG